MQWIGIEEDGAGGDLNTLLAVELFRLDSVAG
jgi:hypothetical protein